MPTVITLENIFGLMQEVINNKGHTHIIVSVIMAVHVNFILPFVGNDYYCELGTSLYKSKDPLFPNVPSGMVRAVLEMRLPVVLLLRCHGLSRRYMRQLVRILS